MTTAACETWSIALEQDRHGALPPEERRALEQHLAGCPACTAERARLAVIDADLAALDGEAPAGWDALHARLDRARRARKRDTILGILAAFGLAGALLTARRAVVGVFFDSFGAGLAAGLLTVMGIAAIGSFVLFRRFSAGRPGTELIAALRADYRRRIRGARFFAFFSPAFILWLVATNARMWGSGAGGMVLRVGIVLVAAALGLRLRFRGLPRLERELRDLEGR